MIRFVIFLFSISMFSQGYETQKYEVVKTLGDIELRFYPPAMKAKVSAGGNFSRLFKYINGNNEQGEKILSLIHISEPTRHAQISYAVFCLKKKKV